MQETATWGLLAAGEPVPLWGIAALLFAIAAGAAWIIADREARQISASLRVPTPADASPVWIVLGVMMLVYVYTPVLMRSLYTHHASPATAPTTMPIDLSLAIRSGLVTYGVGIGAAVAMHAFLRTPARRLLGLAPPTRPQLRFGVAVALLAIPLTYCVSMISSFAFERMGVEHPTSHPMLQWMEMLRDRPGLRAAAIVSAVVMAPVFEEVFFRGHLQTGLLGAFRSRGTAIVIASVLFASLHPWWTIPPIFVLSVCLGVLYERTNNLWLVIAVHVAFNAISTSVFLMT